MTFLHRALWSRNQYSVLSTQYLVLSLAILSSHTCAQDRGPQLSAEKTSRWRFGVVVKASAGPVNGIRATMAVPKDWPEQTVTLIRQDKSRQVGGITFRPLDDGVNRFVVNFSSVSARNGNVGQIDYTAAKGAIESATKTAAREFSGYRARVNAIAPGPVNTPMLAAVGEDGIKAMGRATLVGRIAEPADMANFVCALADPKISGYVTGQVFQVNGGMYLA